MSAKIGRPTDNPKEERITVRLDAESVQILNDYCVEKNVARADAVREGIKRLKKKQSVATDQSRQHSIKNQPKGDW